MALVWGCESRDTAPAQPPLPSPAPVASTTDSPSTARDARPTQHLGELAPLDVSDAPEDAQRSASGLMSKVLLVGSGRSHPAAEDEVKISITGWTHAGQEFVSYHHHPLAFPVYRAIPGLVEGLQLMVEGETRRFWVPAQLAYGDQPGPDLPAGPLTFDIELKKFAAAPPPPADLRPPPTARRTRSGLRYRVSNPGQGHVRPKAQDGVVVSYAAWTAEGRLFDHTSDWPRHLRITTLIPALKEALRSMVSGERRTLWVPASLAYAELTPAQIELPRDDFVPNYGAGYRLANRFSCTFWLPGDMQRCQADAWRQAALGPIVFDLTLEALDAEFDGSSLRAVLSVDRRRARPPLPEVCDCRPDDPLCSCL